MILFKEIIIPIPLIGLFYDVSWNFGIVGYICVTNYCFLFEGSACEAVRRCCLHKGAIITARIAGWQVNLFQNFIRIRSRHSASVQAAAWWLMAGQNGILLWFPNRWGTRSSRYVKNVTSCKRLQFISPLIYMVMMMTLCRCCGLNHSIVFRP